MRNNQTAREQQERAQGFTHGDWKKHPIEVKVLRHKSLVVSWHWKLADGLTTQHQKVEIALADIGSADLSQQAGDGMLLTVRFTAGSAGCFDGFQCFDSVKKHNGRCIWQPAREAFSTADSTKLSCALTNSEAKIRKDLKDLLSIGSSGDAPIESVSATFNATHVPTNNKRLADDGELNSVKHKKPNTSASAPLLDVTAPDPSPAPEVTVATAPARPLLQYLFPGDLRYMKVGQLQQACEARGLATSGTKNDLIVRLSQYLTAHDDH